MQEIYEAYIKADAIVWASPMYWGYLTAQIKTVQDRMEALAWEGFYDKIFIVILTYRHHVDSAVNMFKRISPYFRIELHIHTCCTYDKSSGNDIPIKNLSDNLNEVYKLGTKLGIR
jgi:multimeric flavodoxin WrbA